MKLNLNLNELNLILESLDYTKQKFEDYQYYPSHEFKKQKIDEVNAIRQKISSIK